MIEVEGPDGAIHEFPDGTPDNVIKNVMAQNYGPPQAVAAPQPLTIGERAARVGKSALRDVIQGAGELGGIVYNPVAYGVGQLTGNGYTPLAEQARQATQRMGLPEPSTPTERISSAGGRAVTGAAGMVGLGGAIPGAIGKFMTAAPGSQLGGAVGSGLLGQTAKEADAPLPVQIAASLGGGLLGARAGGMMDVSPEQTQMGEMVRRFERAGVEPSAQGVSTSPMAQRVSSGIENVPVVGAPAAARRAATYEQAGQAFERMKPATPLQPEVAGNVLQTAARRTIERTRDVGSKLYDRAANMVKDRSVVPMKTVQQIDETLADLSTFPETNAEAIRSLTSIRNDLTQDGSVRALSVQQMRDLRTALNSALGRPEIRSDKITALKRMVPMSLSDDIKDAIADNPKALEAYKKADTFWRERAQTIDKALSGLLGKRGEMSPEVAAGNIMNMTGPKGDVGKLRSIMRDLMPEERDDIVATVIQNLGMKDGQFNPAQFSTRVNAMTPAAKEALFGMDRASALDNLAKVSRRIADNARFQPTGSAPMQIAGGVLAGGAALMNPATAVQALPVLAGANITSRMMASPKFVRWLADYAKAPTPEVIARLSALAADDPEIAAFAEQITGGQ